MTKKHPVRKDLPRVAVASVVFREGKVLLVKRANEPSQGMWAVPGGSVKPGETLRAAVERETREETGLKVIAGDPVHVFDLIEKDAGGRLKFHYVIIDLAAEYLGGELCAGDDAEEAGWISPSELCRITITPGTKKLLRKLGFALA